MTRRNNREMGTDLDVLGYALEVGGEYGVRIRLSINPLPRPSGDSTHAVIARAYWPNGKAIAEVEHEQCYFPGGTSKTVNGCYLYLLHRLSGTLDEWYARKRRAEETWEPGELTPLDQYIAGSF